MSKVKKSKPCSRCRMVSEHTPACVELRQYRNLWAFVTVVTVAMIAVTVTLNVMHAPPSWGARAVGGLPPVFVFFCVEMVARIPGTGFWLSFGRIAASIVVASLSFAISYQQQMELVVALGFVGWIAYAFPVIIDGVMVVSTLSLVEVTRKVRELRRDMTPTAAVTAAISAPVVEPATEPAPVPVNEPVVVDTSDTAPSKAARRAAPRTSAKVPAGVKPSKRVREDRLPVGESPVLPADEPRVPLVLPAGLFQAPAPVATGADVADQADQMYTHDVSMS